MKDITGVSQGSDGDLRVVDTIVPKAANVLQVQLGTLEYAPDFGVDLVFFLDPDLTFQNESFKAYLIQRLSESHVNVNQVIEALTTFVETLVFEVGSPENSGGLIR
jgi:hypothetical protein